MVKALAVEVAGFQAVSGATKDFLLINCYYLFHFPHAHQADEFKTAVRNYLPATFAHIEA